MTKSRWLLFCILTLAVVSLGLTSSSKVEVFDSPLTLKVFVRVSPDVPDRVLGFTPVSKGHRIRINPGTFWYVRPSGELTAHKLDRLTHDVRRYGIPGLDLSDHWELTDAGLQHLRNLPSLRMLDLSRTRLTNTSAESIATLMDLRILALPEAFNDRGLAALRKLSHLRDLSLDRTHVTDAVIRLLGSYAQLENLDLSDTAVSDHGLNALMQLPHLKKLVLGGRITDGGAPAFQKMKSLQQLDISQTQITNRGLVYVAALPNLQSVYLSRSIGDAGLAQLSSSRSLQSLDLSEAAITDVGIRSLAKIQSLRELDISQTPIDDQAMAALALLPNLRMLELSDTHVTNAGLTALSRLKHLEILSLSWQKLTRDDLRAMARLPQVKTIVLNGIPLMDSTMSALHRFNHAGPWSRPTGIEEAGFEAPPLEDTALQAPVSASKAAEPSIELPRSARIVTTPIIHFHSGSSASNPPGMHNPIPLGMSNPRLLSEKMPQSAPSGVDSLQTARSPDRVAWADKKAASTDVLSMEHLREKSDPYMPGHSTTGRSPSIEDITVPEEKAALLPKKSSEDDLLNSITQQSNRTHHGGFSGLTGMRQIRLAQNESQVGDMDNGAQAHIKMQEDTPENSVGEIVVGARR